uniref:Stress-response A/B barrel domain-containing protein n=1 Tax=Plectus sambesii TaxID=2011161 RepID=A0A914VWA0_9BILA
MTRLRHILCVSILLIPMTILALSTSVLSASRDIKVFNYSGKIRHCVFIRFKPEINETDKKAIYFKIFALKDRIDGMLNVTFGKNVNKEGLDHGYSDGFTVDFLNLAARDRYLLNAEHQEAGASIVAAAIEGRRGVFVFDLQL